MPRGLHGAVRGGRSGGRLCVVAFALSVAGAQSTPPEVEAPERLAALRREIASLEAALAALDDQERGILGEIERLDAELRLRRAEVDEATLRLDEAARAVAGHDAALEHLDRAQQSRRRYLAFRLREVYKAGPDRTLRHLLAGQTGAGYWEGLRYASYLSSRDGRILAAYRADAAASERERAALAERRIELEQAQSELVARRDGVAASRARRAAVLEGIRRDERRQRQALVELREAAAELGRLAGTLGGPETAPAPDIRAFKGRLDWPTEGELRAGFGSVVHPDFATRVPHPGWDLAADFGSDIHAIFDGRVVFADWMRGYGLTAIVDHGDGVLSIYAHASALLVQEDEPVGRGQVLGQVGDTGSLSGPFLYFELRVDGQAVDPAAWMRRP